MTTDYHDPIEPESPGRSFVVNRPLGQIDAAIDAGFQRLNRGGAGSLNLGPDSDFRIQHIVLGDTHLWPDQDGNLRFKGTQPTNNRDGAIVKEPTPVDPPPDPPPDGLPPITGAVSPRRLVQFLAQGYGFNTVSSLVALDDDTLLVGTGSTIGSYSWVLRANRPFIGWPHSQSLAQRFVYCMVSMGGGVVMAGTGPYGRVYRSADSGITWAQIQELRGFREGAEIRAMINLGGGVLLAGNAKTGRIYRSTNNGSVWASVRATLTGGQRVWDFAIGTGDRVHAATGGNRAQTYYSDDRGATWTPAATQPNVGREVGAIAALPAPDGRLICGTGETNRIPFMFTSDDGGQTWDNRGQITPPNEAGLRVMSILPLGNGRILAATGNRKCHIFESRDRGNTWQYVASPGNADWGYDMVRAGNNVYVTITNPTAIWQLI